MSKRRNTKDDLVITLIIAIAIAVIVNFIIKYIGVIFLCVIGIGAIAIATWIIVKTLKKPKEETKEAEPIPEIQDIPQVEPKAEEDIPEISNEYAGKYEARALLTDHELHYYKTLKPIADKLGLSIVAKVRMADLVKPTANYYRERSEYMSYFGKIKSKHIDFALCDPADLAVKLLIELDDRSHENIHTMERDEFVEKIYQDTGYKLLRTYTNWDLEKKIRDALGITEEDINSQS